MPDLAQEWTVVWAKAYARHVSTSRTLLANEIIAVTFDLWQTPLTQLLWSVIISHFQIGFEIIILIHKYEDVGYTKIYQNMNALLVMYKYLVIVLVFSYLFSYIIIYILGVCTTILQY